MENSILDETPTVTMPVTKSPPAGERTRIKECDVGQRKALASLETGPIAVVDVAQLPNADTHVLADEGVTPEGDRTTAEPNLSIEHKAKLQGEQQKLVGLGIVPPEGRPPEK
ncbi:MAG: hypothetical protein ABSB97_05070 [Thermoplasmata archaeon]|jgi:hypothetical protein